MLTLANGVLRDRVLHLHEPLVAALVYLQQALEKRGVVAFDASNAKKREEAVALTLEVSLIQLDTDERKRYEELAIFPEDVNIPLATVSRFWRATGNFDVLDTDKLCQRLANLSLLLRCDLSSRQIQLHDTIRKYLRTRVAPHLVTFNQQFLDSYTLAHWADLTQEEGYLWDFLVQHLCQAECWKELHTTFTDVRFLAKKVLVRGVVALEEDLLQAWNGAQAWQERHEPVPDAATWLRLQRRIGQISHLMSQVHTLSEIGGVLLAHLGWEKELLSQRQQAKTLFAPPFLTAWHPLPARSSSALLRTFTGHTDKVTACAFSSNGRSVVSAASDGTLKIWDAFSGKGRLTLMSKDDVARRMLYDFDEGRLTLTSLKKLVKTIWSMNTDDNIHSKLMSLQETVEMIRDFASGKKHTEDEWSHTIMIDACVFSPDGRFIITASKDETLRIWNASSPKKYRILDSIALLNTFVFSPNGRFIITGSKENKTLRVWDTSTGKERFTFSGHSTTVTACAISPDGRWIISASVEGPLKVWDAASGVERFSLEGYVSSVHSYAVSPNSHFIVYVSSDHSLKVGDLRTGACVLTFPVDGDLQICAFHPDGEHLVAWGDQGIFFLRLVQ